MSVGAPSASASRTSVTAGRTSYSTATASAASRAAVTPSATTIATASPTKRTQPTASGSCSSFRIFRSAVGSKVGNLDVVRIGRIGHVRHTDVAVGDIVTPVSTASTPGRARAAETSIETTRACACGVRTNTA